MNDASNSRTLAHELGHACNLPDIYNDVGNGDGSPLIGRLQEEDMPFDWNNGVGPEFFPAYDTLYNVIPLLLMYGFESDYKADIPGGAILGFADAESDVGIQVPALRQVGRMLLNRSPRSR